MTRRSIKELDEKFQVLADLLHTEIIGPNDEKPGIYLRFELGRYRAYQKVQTTVTGKDEPVWVGASILSDGYLTVTQMYDRINAAIKIITSLNLIPASVAVERLQASQSNPT